MELLHSARSPFLGIAGLAGFMVFAVMLLDHVKQSERDRVGSESAAGYRAGVEAAVAATAATRYTAAEYAGMPPPAQGFASRAQRDVDTPIPKQNPYPAGSREAAGWQDGWDDADVAARD
jgi:hypothetical protein